MPQRRLDRRWERVNLADMDPEREPVGDDTDYVCRFCAKRFGRLNLAGLRSHEWNSHTTPEQRSAVKAVRQLEKAHRDWWRAKRKRDRRR